MASPDDGYTNILQNVLQPVDVRKISQVFGVAEYVAFEVLISYLARYVFKIEKRSIMELVAIHAVSIPFIGGLGAMAGENNPLTYDAPYGDMVMDGAKGVPGVFAAQYICNTALAGLHAPKLQFQDILVTAASKIITRPFIALIWPYIGITLKNNLDILETLFNSKQRAVSRLLSD